MSFFGAIESRFVWTVAQPWLAAEYGYISVYLSVVYLVLVFQGKRWMTDKPAFSLRRILTMWNTGLAVFSILGCWTCAASFLRNLRENGFTHSVCNDWIHYAPENAHVALWCLLFLLSKAVELGDTAFIVLRKTPLSFLHWYHHVTALIYCAWFSAESPALSNWIGTTNYLVHSVMYSYYTAKAAGVRVPRWVSQMITTLQLVQFVLGVITMITALILKTNGAYCDASYPFIYVGMIVYTSYFVLFLNFFYQRYLWGKN